MPTTIDRHEFDAPAAPCGPLAAPSGDVALRLRGGQGQILLTVLPAPRDAEAG
jgi:hypothetical protein